MTPVSSHWRLPRILAWVIATVITLAYGHIPNDLHAGAERAAYDRLVKWRVGNWAETRLVLVDIDEKSLAAVGPWPWPRETVARLITQLTGRYQVAALGLDMVFADPRAGDTQLLAALSDPRVTLSQTFDMAMPSDNQVGQLANTFSAEHYPGALMAQAGGYVANHRGLLPPQAQVGHISPIIDPDGKVRRLYPVICWAQECSMALSVRIWQSLMQAGALTWQSSPGKSAWLFDAQADTRLPIDRDGAVWVPYRVPAGGFQYVSASDVVEGKVAPERLNQLIVLVGSTALGLGDRVATPLDAIAPGLEVHAQVLSALLDGALLEVRSVAWWQTLLVFGLLGVWLWFWPARGQKSLITWVALAFTGVVAGLAGVVLLGSWVIALTPWVLWVVILGVVWFALESARLSHQLRHVASQFSHFLPASLVKRVLRDPEVRAESERQTLTVLVADMRGFTQACEGKSPEAAALLAQQCLSVLSAEVARYQGTIEKYTGDGLMAMWGAPLSDAEHAQHALQAAHAMHAAVHQMQSWLAEHGFAPMRVSVGINTGEMAVGLFGSQSHLAWTAQGDAVNLANRIEQLTRTVGRDLLVGEMTAQLIGLAQCEFMGTHMVKGRSQPVSVYAIKGH